MSERGCFWSVLGLLLGLFWVAVIVVFGGLVGGVLRGMVGW